MRRRLRGVGRYCLPVQDTRISFLSRSCFARPNSCVFRALILLTVPSTGPELHCWVRPAVTAAMSRRSPTMNDLNVGRSWSTAAIHCVSLSWSPEVLDHAGETGDMPNHGIDLGTAGPDRPHSRLVRGAEVAGQAVMQAVTCRTGDCRFRSISTSVAESMRRHGLR